MGDDLGRLDQFAQTCAPALYPGHATFAKAAMGKRQREMLGAIQAFVRRRAWARLR